MSYDFFFSYPRMEWTFHLKKFYEDLHAAVKQLRGVTTDCGFRDREGIVRGSDWEKTLLDALQTSRTMVAIYCPAYFNRDGCLKELRIFQQRQNAFLATGAANAALPHAMKPVKWIAPFTAPADLALLQYDTHSDEFFTERGLSYFLQTASSWQKNKYRKFFNDLAKDIVKTADNVNLPQLPSLLVDDPLDATPAEPARDDDGLDPVEFVYTAPTSNLAAANRSTLGFSRRQDGTRSAPDVLEQRHIPTAEPERRPPMGDLKILHTSDLLAGAPASRGVWDEVIGDLATHLPESIDYLVVSGNLTADASETSFQKAGAILRRMAETVLMQRDGLQLNRVLIVPGPRDRGEGGDFRAFTTFHDQFFENEIRSRCVEQFDPAEVIVRDLKDLTLLGLTYWRGSPGDGKGPCSTAALKDALVRAKKRKANLLYTEQTPTVLVSAGTLLLDPDDPTSFGAIRRDFGSSFKTTIHCFGSGDAVVSLKTPTTLDHVGLGTGPRNASGFWPVVFNAIKVSPQAKHNRELQILGVETFVQSSERAGLDPGPWLVKGQLDEFYERIPYVRVSDEDLYAPLLSDLEKKFTTDNNRFVVLDGFPGAGKGAFYKFLQGRDRFVETRLHVTPVRVNNIIDYRNLGASILAQVAEGSPPKTGMFRLLVIHDTCFGRLPNERKNELKDVVKDETHGLNPGVSGHFDGVLLLRTTSNYSLVVDPVMGTAALTFGPAEKSTIEQLVSDYSWVAPVERRQVRRATGDYLGLSQLILNSALREFSGRSGAEPLHSGSSLQLLRTVLETDPVDRELHLHRTTMEQMNVDVCRYIEEKVDACAGEEANGSGTSVDPANTEVIIDIEEITESLRDATKKQGVGSVLEMLAKCGILERVGTETPSRYRVRVLAPFLARSGRKGNRMTGKPEIPWPTITNEDLSGPVDIVIMTALREEREAVLAKLEKKQRLNPHHEDIQVGYYSKVPFTMPEDEAPGFYRVVVTDMLSMGEVDAALAATSALRRWKAKIIIVVGIAGGVAHNKVALGDVLVASEVAYYYGLQSFKDGKAQIRWNAHGCDPGLWMAANHFALEAMKPYIAEPRPEAGEPKVHTGPIASGDTAIEDEALLAALSGPFPTLVGVEMEGWGVISAAAQAATPKRFFMVRGVSNLADSDKDSPRVAEWRAYARDVAAAYAIALLQSGPLPVEPQQERNG